MGIIIGHQILKYFGVKITPNSSAYISNTKWVGMCTILLYHRYLTKYYLINIPICIVYV